MRQNLEDTYILYVESIRAKYSTHHQINISDLLDWNRSPFANDWFLAVISELNK